MLLNDEMIIFAPHMDDEVLACGGFLYDLRVKAEDITEMPYIFYFNTNEHPALSKEENKEYDEENTRLLKKLNCYHSTSQYCKMNRLSSVPSTKLITEIEELINLWKPETIMIPFPSYNQDHRTVFEHCITASRIHDKNHYVRNILMYEEPETLQTNRVYTQFQPNLFVSINIEEKLELVKIYKTQLREHRSLDKIRSLATVRGMQCNAPYAEAFQVIRMTV